MKFIENIDENIYEEFVSKHKKSHFMQSYYFGEVMKYKNFNPYYVGLEENGKIIASALLLEKKLFKNICYFYCPRGFILDYNNYDVLKTFTKELKKYCKKKNAIYLKIDPDIKRHNLDVDGNIIGQENNYKLMNKLEKLGYKHKGLDKKFVYEQPRFTFRLNLEHDFENIYSRMHATTRKILNKKNEYDLITYKGNENDIEDFYITMKETAERESLLCNPISYYKAFYNILNKKNMSDLHIVKANINLIKEKYKNKIEELNKKIEELNNKETGNKEKTKNKINECQNELNKLIKEHEMIKEIKESEVILSSIITVKYNDKVWTIHGGNTTKLRHLNSNYWLYYTIIKDAHENGYKIIDFFGTSGEANPSKEDSIYGIHNFKKRLGGEYIEFIGEYDLVINKFMYNTYHYLKPIYRKIKNKF